MNHPFSMHQFAEVPPVQFPGLRGREHVQLTVIQQPRLCKVSVGKEKDRRVVDPPPIVQLKISQFSDPGQNYLQSPYYFVVCSLPGYPGATLTGNVVSSLHRMKDLDGTEGAYFVFGDLSVKREGSFDLRFDLYETLDEECHHIATTESQKFAVLPSKGFVGLPESTPLTRAFATQGLRLRLRKEPRSLLTPKGPASDDYRPRHYQRGNQSLQHPSLQQAPSADSMIRSPPTSRESQRSPNESSGYTIPIVSSMSFQSRGFSNNQDSYGGYEEPTPKRPRTGSEHSQAQSTIPSTISSVPDTPQIQPEAIYAEPHISAFGQLASSTSQALYSFDYVPASQEIPREHYFSHRSSSQIGSPTYQGVGSQQIQQQNFLPQPHLQRVSPHTEYYAPLPSIHQSQRWSQAAYNSTPSLARPYPPQELNASVSAADWSTMGMSTSIHPSTSLQYSRESYNPYGGQNQNVQGSSDIEGGLPEVTLPGN